MGSYHAKLGTDILDHRHHRRSIGVCRDRRYGHRNRQGAVRDLPYPVPDNVHLRTHAKVTMTTPKGK